MNTSLTRTETRKHDTAKPSTPEVALDAIARLEDVSPAYAGMIAKRADLQVQKALLDNEIASLLKFLDSVGSLARDANAEVAALLSDLPATPPRSGPSAEEIDAARARLPKVQGERQNHDQALIELERLLQRERTVASQLVCAAIRGQYGKVVDDICRALLAAREKQLVYHALTSALEERGVRWASLVPMPPQLLGDPRDNHGKLAWYLHEASREGYFDKSDIPQQLQR